MLDVKLYTGRWGCMEGADHGSRDWELRAEDLGLIEGTRAHVRGLKESLVSGRVALKVLCLPRHHKHL